MLQTIGRRLNKSRLQEALLYRKASAKKYKDSKYVFGAWCASLKCTVVGVDGASSAASPSEAVEALLYEKYRATAAPAAATAGAARALEVL